MVHRSLAMNQNNVNNSKMPGGLDEQFGLDEAFHWRRP
jgi:hypothetical protein